MKSALIPILGLTAILVTAPAFADETPTRQITLKDHAFTPAELDVPAGQKIKLTVKNEGDTTAEFESSDLDREKIVSSNDEITVFIGPLSPGSYGFFDDFHRATTGTIVAK